MCQCNFSIAFISFQPQLEFELQSGAAYHSLGFEDKNLGSSPCWWAATVATYCPSRPGELPKFLSSKPCEWLDAPRCKYRRKSVRSPAKSCESRQPSRQPPSRQSVYGCRKSWLHRPKLSKLEAPRNKQGRGNAKQWSKCPYEKRSCRWSK